MSAITRRGFVQAGSLFALGTLAGCSLKRNQITGPVQETRDFWLRDEKHLIESPGNAFPIVCQGRSGSRVLRLLTRDVPPDLDLTDVAMRMEHSMRQAGGVGIAGPQVGLNLRITTVMLDYKTDHPHVVFARNPYIIERSDDLREGYEGCLSVPEKGGLVRRNAWVVVRFLAEDGTQRIDQFRGANAVLWQHELDHLEGILYVDKLIGDLLPIDEMRRRRKAEELSSTENRPSQSTWRQGERPSPLMIA